MRSRADLAMADDDAPGPVEDKVDAWFIRAFAGRLHLGGSVIRQGNLITGLLREEAERRVAVPSRIEVVLHLTLEELNILTACAVSVLSSVSKDGLSMIALDAAWRENWREDSELEKKLTSLYRLLTAR